MITLEYRIRSALATLIYREGGRKTEQSRREAAELFQRLWSAAHDGEYDKRMWNRLQDLFQELGIPA